MTDITYLSPEDLQEKFGIPTWFRKYRFTVEWKNYSEKTVAQPLVHGGLIERVYFRIGDKCFAQCTLSVPRFKQTVRSGTAVRYLEIDLVAVGRTLLRLAKSGLQRLNKQAASGISPNQNEIYTTALELRSVFVGTPYGALLAGAIKVRDYQKMLNAFGKISEDMENDRKQLAALLSKKRFKLSETKVVDEFASLVPIDTLTKVLIGEIPCDDWIRKLDDGVVAKRDELPDYIDAEPDETQESMMKKLIEKAGKPKGE